MAIHRLPSPAAHDDRMKAPPTPSDRRGHIYLVGPPGAGKTTLGPRLAAVLQLQFHDCDRCIEQLAGTSVGDVFSRDGERKFRELEEQMLAELSAGPPAVIATGGGTILRAANRKRMKQQGRIVYLHAEPQTLLQRVASGQQRPLLSGPEPDAALQRLIAERDPLYRTLADYELKTDSISGEPAGTDLATAIDHVVQQLSAQLQQPTDTAT